MSFIVQLRLVEVTGFEPATGAEPRHYPWPAFGLKCASLLGPLWLFRCFRKDPSGNLSSAPGTQSAGCHYSFPGTRAFPGEHPLQSNSRHACCLVLATSCLGLRRHFGPWSPRRHSPGDLLPLPTTLHSSWGEGRGEGRQQAVAIAAAPHPNPLPVEDGERELACQAPEVRGTRSCARDVDLGKM